MNNHKRRVSGFTLIEILIVIGIIAVLAAIVLIAVNPARQFAKANDAQRSSNINTILNAVGQYLVDQKGATTTLNLTTTDRPIASGSGNVDLCTLLVPTYVAALPVDPTNGTPQPSVLPTGCGAYNTDYRIRTDATGRLITITADGEATSTIVVTR
jgi:prepilin-type N-terminal cleavage/methylation domain-containing protein